MSKDIQRDVAVLSAAKRGLIYLTANDWALIAAKAVRKDFKQGATMVEEGKLTNGVYLVLSGTARVEIPRRVTFPAIGPGEVCGEVSFIDDLPATARVVALEPLEAYFWTAQPCRRCSNCSLTWLHGFTARWRRIFHAGFGI